MDLKQLTSILSNYQLDETKFNCKEYGSGLINRTYCIENTYTRKKYILQKINTDIFKTPQTIADNISKASNYLSEHFPDYYFPTYIKTKQNTDYYIDHKLDTWRLIDFVQDSYSIDSIEDLEQAYLTAYEFGRFTSLFENADIDNFKPSIPDFHNLSLRYDRFNVSIENALPERLKDSKSLIDFLKENNYLLDTYNDIIENKTIPTRLIHCDTKINNILFNKYTNKPICIIDLDTLMPGYFISDLGDMIRTMVCNSDENERNKDIIVFRPEYYNAICTAYSSALNLTETEKKLLPYAGKYMVYMQALRFVTDYLQNDVYYPILHKKHNLERTQNQVWLLEELLRHT